MLLHAEAKQSTEKRVKHNYSNTFSIKTHIEDAWHKIAPSWPLENLIAVNPLQGLEDISFEEALVESAALFQRPTLPAPMDAINRETIKWCQAFFDEGQAVIAMPRRDLGLYKAWRQLAPYDERLTGSDAYHQRWIKELPDNPEQLIAKCLHHLTIAQEKKTLFLTLLLTTLPGWASFIKYRTDWVKVNNCHRHPITKVEYLAVRLAMTCLLWPKAGQLISWYEANDTKTFNTYDCLKQLINAEHQYRLPLLRTLSQQASLIHINQSSKPDAQLVFCIDVRSEPFRKALESQGHYETFGYAGFFGLPVTIKGAISQQSYSSCPVLLEPKHTVSEMLECSKEESKKVHQGNQVLIAIRCCYEALKYSFATPFALVEVLGPWCGIWMTLRTLAPRWATWLKQSIVNLIRPTLPVKPNIESDCQHSGIPFNHQCLYAENALRMIDLTKNFAPLIVLCGHGSHTQNNSYASGLDCGACAGHEGASNARILAAILNQKKIRDYLAQRGILIPDETLFLAAKHNTTTDEVDLFFNPKEKQFATQKLDQLISALDKARECNTQWRCKQMGLSFDPDISSHSATKKTQIRSADWAQVRPEWGLARNAAFIVAPRSLTKNVNLSGRAFLHSYNWNQDEDGSLLTTILTAPMIVAQWINSQYLFSSLDNIAYGSGSKVTHNITSKIGVMQGNASDLMHGLPLQSIYSSDTKAYHVPMRLVTVVYAPHGLVNKIIKGQPLLQKLFSNGWVALACIEPENGITYCLQRNLTWEKVNN